MANDAELGSEEVPHSQHARDEERKLPQETVASLSAERLGVRGDDEALRPRLHHLVQTFGRTQALALCDQILASEEQKNGEKPEQFFALIEAKGRLKPRPWQTPRPPLDSHSRPPTNQENITALMIAEQVGEKQWAVRQLISRSVSVLGIQTVLSLLQETHIREADGGMMLPDGSRRRTPGGVYFFLVKQAADAAQQKQIFGYVSQGTRGTPPPPQTQPQASTAPPAFSWLQRHPIVQETDEGKGKVHTVKITLIGRPGTVVERGQCVVTSMQQGPTIPSLPKGLPLPPKVEATTYTVYIASKHWRKVTEALGDLEDVLIVEGWPMMDTKEHRIAVFANTVTTRKLQIAQKQAQQP